jgi:hypothetical protein
MNEEKMKILEMVSEGIITAEEANVLLETLSKADEAVKSDSEKGSFKKKLGEELNKAKEDLNRSKDWISEKINNVDFEGVKDKFSKSLKKVDEAIDKIDKKLINIGEKVIINIKKNKETGNTEKETIIDIDVEED